MKKNEKMTVTLEVSRDKAYCLLCRSQHACKDLDFTKVVSCPSFALLPCHEEKAERISDPAQKNEPAAMKKQDEGMEVEQGLALIVRTVEEVNRRLSEHDLRLEAKLEIKPHYSPKHFGSKFYQDVINQLHLKGK